MDITKGIEKIPFKHHLDEVEEKRRKKRRKRTKKGREKKENKKSDGYKQDFTNNKY